METPDFRVFHVQRKWEPDFATKNCLENEKKSKFSGFLLWPVQHFQRLPVCQNERNKIRRCFFLKRLDWKPLFNAKKLQREKKKISLDFPWRKQKMGHPWDILDENKGKRNTPPKWTCTMKRDHFKWKGKRLPTNNFQVQTASFRGGW